jgi:hypothetical protein
MNNDDKICDLLITCYENTMLRIPFQYGKFYPIYDYSLRKGYVKCNKKFICHSENPEDTDYMGRFKRCIDKK